LVGALENGINPTRLSSIEDHRMPIFADAVTLAESTPTVNATEPHPTRFFRLDRVESGRVGSGRIGVRLSLKKNY